MLPSPLRDRWLLLGILLLAFLLRAAGIVWGHAYNSDGGQSDAVEACEVAVAFLNGEEPAQYLGQPRFRPGSKLPGPAWTLLCAAGLHFGGSPESLAWLFVILNIGAIWLIHRLALLTVGPTAGLCAAAMLAVAPLAVQNSLVVFNPAVLPLLTTALFLSLWQTTQVDRSHAIFWVVFLPGLLAQFHMASIFLLPAIVVILWAAARPLHLRWLTLGAGGVGLLYLPYLLGEWRNHWANTRAMFGAVGADYTFDPLGILAALLRFFLNYWAPRSLYTASEWAELHRATFGGELGHWLANGLAGLVGLGLAAGLWLHVRQRWQGFGGLRLLFAREPGLTFLLLLVDLTLLTALAAGLSFRTRYGLILLAPLFCLAGAGATTWLAHRRWRPLFLGALLSLLAVNAWFLLSMYRFQGRHIESGPRFLGSFRQLESIYQALRRAAGPERAVEVMEQNFVPPPTPDGHRPRVDLDLIRRHVAWREKQRSDLPGPRSTPVVFDLLAGETGPQTSLTAYAGHGLRLVKRTAD